MCNGIAGQINREAALVGGPYSGQIAGSRKRLVCVGEAALSLVGVNQLTQRFRVNLVTYSGQVARLIMSPQLTRFEFADLVKERVPIKSALSACDL